jgi:ketosteroid isomerase-like protein
MAQSNADVIVHALEHWNRTGQILESAWSPNLEYHTAPDLPDTTVYRGFNEYRRMVEEWRASFDDLHLEIERVVERGDYVVIGASLCGRVRGTQEQVRMPESYLITVRNGQAIELHEYRTTEAALAAIPGRATSS